MRTALVHFGKCFGSAKSCSPSVASGVVEDGLVDHHQVVVNIVNEDGVVEQRQVLLGQSELYLDSDGSQVSSEIFTNLGLEQETVIVKDMKAENVEFGEVNSITIVENENI